MLTTIQGKDSPSAYSFFNYMIGIVLIVSSGVGYKIIFRTKLRNPSDVDLQTGRRTLSEEEIHALDDYFAQSRLNRFYSFIQMW
jgi:yeast amino acid transporter